MLPTFLRKLHEISRRLVVRVLLIAALALLAVILARVGARFIPFSLKGLVGADAVDHILSIIANSMLSVTTFSLTVMAAAHRNVASQWTPRAHQMLLQDTVTHTVLATFVGAYLYALAAIILRDMGLFDGTALVVLFATTLLVVALIIIAIIRWISHMEMLGSLIETAQRIEESTTEAFCMRQAHPALGGRVLEPDAIPEAAHPVAARESGYIKQIWQEPLQQAAREAGAHVWLLHPVGSFVPRGTVMARTESEDPKLLEAIADGVELGTLRDFSQDPDFGLTNLREIAVRALSPGINDPGTAEDILRRITRVLMRADAPLDGAASELLYDRLYLPALETRTLAWQALAPILKDGAERPELTAPFRETFATLAHHVDPGIARAGQALLAQLDDALATGAPDWLTKGAGSSVS